MGLRPRERFSTERIPIDVRHGLIWVVHAEDHSFNLFPLAMSSGVVGFGLESFHYPLQFALLTFSDPLHQCLRGFEHRNHLVTLQILNGFI